MLETAATRALLHRSNGDGTRILYGHFARWDEWAEIDSAYEGHFLERVAKGAFERTFRERRDRIRVLFQRGQDPMVGSKPLGPIEVLREDGKGAAYLVPLLDASYVRDLIPGLDEGLYGASFQFRTLREESIHKVKASDHNPDRLPDRTLKDLELYEFGPVTFPAYDGATAGVRGVRDSALAQKRGRPSTVVTPIRRVELKNRAGRVVHVLIPGQTRFALDAEDVRRRPDLFRPVRSDDTKTRTALRRMQAKPGHTRTRTSLAETLRTNRPAGRVLPPRRAPAPSRVLP